MAVLTRRELLVAGTAIVALAGCAPGQSSGTSASASASGSGDTTLADTAASEQSLLDRYDATIAAYGEVAEPLAALRAQHAEHLAALGLAGPALGAPTVPVTLADALTALRDAEREAAAMRRSSCVATSDAASARLLALIAASEASHVPVLKRLAAT